MLKLSYRLLSLLLALVLLPGHSLAASRSLPIEEDYAFFPEGRWCRRCCRPAGVNIRNQSRTAENQFDDAPSRYINTVNTPF
ncbi:MAG: hypothetical protein ACOX55_09930 [Christensenellales bacterium]|jgi:hypothetical protein